MASLEERVLNLEAQSDKHAATVTALRTDIADLRVELRTEIAAIRRDMALRSEIAAVQAEMARRSDVDALRADITLLRTEARGQFLWMVGAMFSGFVAVISALIGIVYLQVASL